MPRLQGQRRGREGERGIMKAITIEMREDDLEKVITVLLEDVNSVVSADDRTRIATILKAYGKSKKFSTEENWK